VCCEIGNAAALAEAISGMLKCNVIEMGENARKYFDVHFDKAKLMDEMNQRINQAIQGE